MIKPSDALLKAIEIIDSQSQLAPELGITQQAVNDWVIKNKLVPANRIFKIKRLTKSKITVQQL